MLMKAGLCFIISPTQASKALLFARAAATVDAVTFCFRNVGEITLLFIWMSSNIQLRKDLDAKCCFFALCFFLCHVLSREVNIYV